MSRTPPTSPAAAVAQIRRCLSATGRASSGQFCVEGYRLVERALSSRARPVCAVHGPVDSLGERGRTLVERLGARGTAIYEVGAEAFAGLSDRRTFGPILATVGLPRERTFEELTAHGGPVLATSRIKDPGNIGALIRTAHAFGASGVVFLGGTDPFHPKACRTSMGSIFAVPVVRREAPARALAELRSLGLPIVAAGLSPDAVPLHKADLRASSVFLVGSEAHGLDPEVANMADLVTTIPMPPGIDSLSVNAACAVVLYQASLSAGNLTALRQPLEPVW